MKVIVVIADVVNSRQIADRRVFQKRLERSLEHLQKSHSDLVSPPTVTLGDEFQAVYRRADHVFRDFFMLQRLLYPHRLRVAVGVGRLSTRVNKRMSIGMDGPAFHLARQGIIEAKQSGVLLRVMMEHKRDCGWIAPALELLSHMVLDWKKNRLEILQRLLDGEDPRTVAQAMKITGTAVYKNIQAGALNSVRSLCAEVVQAIETERKGA